MNNSTVHVTVVSCPACIEKRRHTAEDWAYHPYAGHGFNGSIWTHPDLETQAMERRAER